MTLNATQGSGRRTLAGRITGWFGGSDAPRKRCRRSNPGVEGLEERKVLNGSMSFNPSTGLLSITGDAHAANAAIVSPYGAYTEVQLKTAGFTPQVGFVPTSQVRTILI
jgi:hypothetical protein